jgi:hypothetical protein
MALLAIVAIGDKASSIVVAKDEEELQHKLKELQEKVARMEPEALERLGLWKEGIDDRHD